MMEFDCCGFPEYQSSKKLFSQKSFSGTTSQKRCKTRQHYLTLEYIFLNVSSTKIPIDNVLLGQNVYLII